MAKVIRTKPLEETPSDKDGSATLDSLPRHIGGSLEPPETALEEPASTELYEDPTIMGMLPWGPLVDYKTKAGKTIKVRRAENIGGLESFWSARKKREDLMRINGVRVYARRGPDKTEMKGPDGKRVWDAVWYMPKEVPPVPAPARALHDDAPAGPGEELFSATTALMKRLSTTKAVEFEEYKRVYRALHAPAKPVLEEI